MNLDDPIETLDLDSVSHNALRRNNISTIAALAACTYWDLRLIRNLGERRVRAIETALAALNLDLSKEYK